MRHRKSTSSLPLALVAIVGSVAAVIGIAGCGGGSSAQAVETTPAPAARPAGPVTARGENEVSARVGSAGGTLELANGGRLEIPAGALSQETEIFFGTGPSAREAWDAETKRPLGPTLEVRPAIAASSGQFRLSAPATQFPDGFEPADLALGHEEEVDPRHLSGSTATRWQMWPARVESGRFVAELPALAGHRVQFGVSR